MKTIYRIMVFLCIVIGTIGFMLVAGEEITPLPVLEFLAYKLVGVGMIAFAYYIGRFFYKKINKK